MVQIARDIFHSGGLRSLYRGFNITLIRDVPGSMAYFATYETLKTYISKQETGSKELSFSTIIMAGGIAGLTNWLVAIVILHTYVD